ncbi:UDP-galactose transporter subfamily protein [Toxoplasma gondii ME49]|uniref:UDP-galactose transporter subfamily protein n=2 Tax=Toxoplasma gondii TaxID=5811 RepID=S8EVV0_TOXGM|nr:UDP-galactose transporter subfamily protein [Toxoplasma gondii ME49]EPT27586.1 UDP-galactose transporter subfamily protein [Toxoplasma gondii ME49]KYF45596.1 UDP-galactose transporter subfamily protein [Toxoplasma gondii ARI]|eukprot:XP_002368806.1 UDP-galactose transporter subfamily protein [Toxoplasma gondii ME49]
MTGRGADEATPPKFVGRLPMKWVAFFLLVVQTVAAVLVLRVSRLPTKSDDGASRQYLNTTAVTMAELVKLVAGVLIVCGENRWSILSTGRVLNAAICHSPIAMLQVGVPAVLYTLQNNLIFVALSNLSGAVYQVTYQFKILTTAVLSVLILHKRLPLVKWVALLILTGGVAIISLPSGDSTTSHGNLNQGNPVIGLIAVFSACLTSGFAGVYLEKILKETPVSIWVRNIQLALYGTVLAVLGAYWNDGDKIQQYGFFQGYNVIVWSAVLLQALGGLIVAAVLKYADNILKCFGNALSIVLSCFVSWWVIGDFVPSTLFSVGAALVLTATFLYTAEPVAVAQAWRNVAARFEKYPGHGRTPHFSPVSTTDVNEAVELSETGDEDRLRGEWCDKRS